MGVTVVVGMDISCGNLCGFSEDKIGKTLLCAQNRGFIQGAEYCYVCTRRLQCRALTDMVVWCKCSSFDLSYDALSVIEENLRK